MIPIRLWLFIAGALVATSSVQADSLDGVWRSIGYGYVFEIKGPDLKAFEVTATTCVPGLAATRDDIAIDGREATFRTRNGAQFFFRAGGSGDHRVMHNEGVASDVRIDRLPRLPAVCENPTTNTP